MARYDVAVIGLGRFGSALALRLVEEGREVLGVDVDEAAVDALADRIDHLAIAEARDEETLRQLDIRPDTLVVLGMAPVAASLMTATALNELGVREIWAKAGSPRHVEALTRLGVSRIIQPEREAGRLAGERAKEEGATSFVCVNHYITNPASVERCQGFAEGLGVELGSSMIDAGQDPAQIQNTVSAYLTANQDVDAILALGPTSAEPTIRALADQGLSGDDIVFATFDLSAEIAQGIRNDVVDFAIDQQPFLQGYLPVVFLTNYARYGVIPSNDVNSGPGFITIDNLDQVEALAGQYR